MKNIAVLFRSGAVFVTALFLLTARNELSAQLVLPGPAGATAKAEPPAETSPAKTPPAPEQPAPAELMKSYLQVRQQLQATQLAIVTYHVEAEASARAQAEAITEKIDSLKAAMAAERERQQLEAQRLTAERERQQAETDRLNRIIVWVAVAAGGVGLLALLLSLFFQWRSVQHMGEIAVLRPQLPAPAGQGLLAGDTGAPSDQAVALSNQRLMAAIERMERRIFEFELTTAQPLVSATANPLNGSDPSRRATSPASDQAARITLLLGKGRSLFNTNKPMDALGCYDEILRIDLNHPEALVRKGATLERLKQDAEAIQCYDQAIAADRKMTLAYLYKGGVCNRLERYEDALKCYEQALHVEEYA